LRRISRTLASAIILALFVLTVTSLVTNMKLVDISKLPTTGLLQQPTSPAPSVSTQAQAIGTPSDAESLAIVLAISAVVVLLIARRRGPKSPLALWRLIGLLIGLAFLWILPQAISTLFSKGVSGGSFQDQQAELVTALASLLVLSALAVTAVVFAIKEHTSAVSVGATMVDAGGPSAVRQTLRSIRARIYSMPEAEVYRDAVIECYSSMTKSLSSRGAEDKPSFTPQELEFDASKKVSALKTDVHTLTRHFEKARYASAPVTVDDVKESMEALERMAGEPTNTDGGGRS